MGRRGLPVISEYPGLLPLSMKDDALDDVEAVTAEERN